MKKYNNYFSTPEAIWYEKIPDSWRSTKMRELFSERNTKVSDKEYAALSVGKMGVVPQLDTAVKTDNGDNRKLIKTGDFAINSRSDRKGAGGISEYDGSASLIITVLKPHNDLNHKFYHYLLRSYYFSEEFYRNGQGLVSDLWTTRWDKMRNIYLPVPPREEQDKIVRYLDWKTSRINHLIHGYQKQIELLKERRLTVIDTAVTKGLNPNVAMKESSTNWMGEIPSHWSMEKIKQHFHIKKDIAGQEGYDVISITQQGLKIKDISTNEGQMAQSYAKYQFVNPGDYAMNHMDLLTGYIGLSDYFGVTSPDYRVFVLDDTDNCDPEYYLYVFQLGYKRKIFYGLGRGAANKGRWRMPAVNFKNYDIPMPPLAEQKEIVAFIQNETSKIDVLIDKIENQISFLREYRTRLISDVVTGQIDVRDVVIPEYVLEEDKEETSEEESEVMEDADN